jgi:2-dehydro-3-deoxygluconokinase
MAGSWDVVVVGEVLVELSSGEPLRDGVALRLGFSGDALNSAAAAAAAGARVALLTRVADDELGDRLVERVAALGVDTALVRRIPGQNGVYFVAADPAGVREFVYVRRGSAASTLEPADVGAADLAATAGLALASGIACAISASAAAAVRLAARSAPRFVYDPNYRPRLTTAAAAAGVLADLAPYASVVTPACPGESAALLGLDDPAAVATACRELGADAVAVTCGERGVLLDTGAGRTALPGVPPPELVDATGAGDVFAGTLAARLALGDPLPDAARLATAAASLSLAGQGGTGRIPSLAQSRAHLPREVHQ